MKKIFSLVLVGLLFIGSVFAVPTWAAKDIDFNKYEVISENEMSLKDTANLLELISLDTPYFEQLCDEGYFDTKFTNGNEGIWFMFVNEGKILSFQAVKYEEDEFVCALKEWKVKQGD